jgi:transposase
VSRFQVLTDSQWERIAGLLPSNTGRRGRPFADSRRVVEGIIYRYRTGIPWRDLPREVFGPWQTVWKRHRGYSNDGTWDRVLQALLAQADAEGEIDWTVSVDATIARAHQHATNTTRPEQDTGGPVRITPRCLRVSSTVHSAGTVNPLVTGSGDRGAG